MIALVLLAQATSPAAVPPPDWAPLPQLQYRRPAELAAEATAFVRGEVDEGRCAAAFRSATGWSLRVDMAVLATPDGQVRRVVPRAIQCPSVEQFAAGLVSRLARDNTVTAGAADTWYRTSVTFAWAG